MKLKVDIEDGIFASSEDRKQWSRIGIPKDHWSYIENQTAKFSPFNLTKQVKLTALNQRQVFVSLVKEIKRNHPLVVCFGEDTDFGALTVGYAILAAYKAVDFPVSILDAQYGSQVSLRRYPRVLLVHNVTTESSPARLEAVRDLILKFRYALRVIVVGGVPKDPIGWWVTKMRYRQTYTLVCKDVSQ